MDLDQLAEWLERHPEIESITITEIVEMPAVEQQPELWWTE